MNLIIQRIASKSNIYHHTSLHKSDHKKGNERKWLELSSSICDTEDDFPMQKVKIFLNFTSMAIH